MRVVHQRARIAGHSKRHVHDGRYNDMFRALDRDVRAIVFANGNTRVVLNSGRGAGRATQLEDQTVVFGLFGIEIVTNVIYKGSRGLIGKTVGKPGRIKADDSPVETTTIAWATARHARSESNGAQLPGEVLRVLQSSAIFDSIVDYDGYISRVAVGFVFLGAEEVLVLAIMSSGRTLLQRSRPLEVIGSRWALNKLRCRKCIG